MEPLSSETSITVENYTYNKKKPYHLKTLAIVPKTYSKRRKIYSRESTNLSKNSESLQDLVHDQLDGSFSLGQMWPNTQDSLSPRLPI